MSLIVAKSTDGGTCWELIRAVEKQWGELGVDLAAVAENAKAPEFISPEENSLAIDWTERLKGRRGWLNPPFTSERITPWIDKCVAESKRGARIILLAPVELDQHWWWSNIKLYSATYVLVPQMTADGVPTTMALSTFGFGVAGMLGRFYWGEGRAERW